jgi:hypothetical membrane protein
MHPRLLPLLATAGPPLFAALTVLAALVKPGYDIAEQTVSDLAVGRYGWIQTANFLILGVAMIAFAVLLRSRRGALFGFAGAAVVACAFYETDLAGAAETSHGATHNMLFLLIFLALIAAFALHGSRLVALGVFAGLFVFVMFAGDVGDPLHGVAGLIERVVIAIPLVWISRSAAKQLDAVAPGIRRVEAANAR